MEKVTDLETGFPALAFDFVPKSLDSGGSDFADGRMAPRAFRPRGPDYFPREASSVRVKFPLFIQNIKTQMDV